MSPTTDTQDKAEEQHARKSLTLKKAVAYLCVVIIVVTFCGPILYYIFSR